MYRIWIAEAAGIYTPKHLIVDGYHYQVTAETLGGCWEKARRVIFQRKKCSVSQHGRRVTARYLSQGSPVQIGIDGRHRRIYIQKLPSTPTEA